jgi:exodeoxyribonuclease VII small subunit
LNDNTKKNSKGRNPGSAGNSPASDETGDPQEAFESRLERLQRIVEELERGDLPLEKAIARYEEGVRVLKTCAETLATARLRVEELSKDADASLGLRPAVDLEDDASDDDDEDA